VLCVEPKDHHVADVVGSPDLDQRLPTLEAGVQISGVQILPTVRETFSFVLWAWCTGRSARSLLNSSPAGSATTAVSMIGNGWGGGLAAVHHHGGFQATGSLAYALIYPIVVPGGLLYLEPFPHA